MIENNVKRDRIKGIFLVVVASILWSTGGMFVKLIEWNPVAIAGSRSLVSAIVLLIYAKRPKITKSKAEIIGIVSYAITVLSFIIANKLTTSANAILLQYTSPIFVAILSVWLLKEKIRWYDALSIIFVFFGMGLFFVNDLGSGHIVGNVIAIFSGFTLAITTIALKKQQDSGAFGITIFGNILAFIISIPFILTDLPSIKTLVIIIIMGIFQLGISYIFYINSLKYVSALEAILITVVEPLLNPLWVYIFTGERPGIYAIIGGFIVIISVTLRSIYISTNSIKENSFDINE